MMEIVKYDVTEAAISEMRSLYMDLTVKDIDDKEGFEAVHSARMVVKGKRIAVEKQRKDFKADALDFGRRVDTEAKKIFSLLEPIEGHLQEQEDVVINERKRIQAEKEAAEQARIQDMIDSLALVGCIMPFFDLATMTDEAFTVLYAEKKAAFEAEQSRIAEEKRLEIERLEKERLEREAEAKRLADERAELDKIKAEQEAERKRLKEEQDKIDAEKRKAERIAFEKQALENARIAAEKATKEKAEREAAEKVAAEAKAKDEAERAEKLRPDREKLLSFANSLLEIRAPEVSDTRAQGVADTAIAEIYRIANRIIKQSKDL
uniref:Uncharacterized protein n=1 Tax=viral metagenome TaxID=1070528 RepID=A0A6M3XS99_9ZZZZ